MPFRLLANFCASLNVVLDSFLKGIPQSLNRIGMKADTIADTGETSCENAIFIIILDAGQVAFVGRSVTPIRSKNARTART
jgi:hypothetical protein